MVQIEVLVRSKQNGLERTLTYKSYLDLISQFDLIGQVDESGNLIPGDPNLHPQHRKKQVNVAVHAAGEGDKITLPELQNVSETEFIPKTDLNYENENVSRETKRRGRPKMITV